MAGGLGLLGRRRAAAVASLLAAVALSLSLTSYPQNSLLVLEEVTPWVLLSLVGAVAAVPSPGARHGLSRLGATRYAALALASVLVVVCQLLR